MSGKARSQLAELKKLTERVRTRLHLTRHNSAFAGLLFDLRGGTFEVDDLSFEVPRELTTRGLRAQFLFDTWERKERDLIKRYLPPDSTVLELGACLGIVSGVTSRLLSDPHRHVVVEADPRLVYLLEANRERNGLPLSVENCLVTRNGDGTFFASRVILSGSQMRGKEATQPIQVPTTTVEQLEAKHGLAFDALIMDIEGSELAFMRENRALLASLSFVAVEFHEPIIGREGIEECEALMGRAGLRQAETRAECSVWLRPGGTRTP